MDIFTLDFAAPQWFLLTLVLPFLVALKMWGRQKSSRGVNAFVSKRLRASLVSQTPPAADWIAYGLQLASLLAFIVALARPQWGYREVETFTEGRNVIIAIDTSQSMMANDLSPNRLTRAKLAAQDLVRNLPDDRIGLIAFAGEPFTQVPLTVDHEAVLEMIDQLDTEIIPRGGTNLISPALLALDSMAEAETSLAALVVFSDGEDHEGGEDEPILKARIKDSDLMIVGVGVGTEVGAVVPDPSGKDGVFVKDEEGNIVRSRLNSTELRELSEVGDGIYLKMGTASTVADVVRQALSKLETQRLQAENRRTPIERYQIPLVAGMLLLVLSYFYPMIPTTPSRKPAKPATTVTAIFFCMLLAPFAMEVKAESNALESYLEGKFEVAKEKYTDEIEATELPGERAKLNLGLGAAAYRSGDFGAAKTAFTEALAMGGPRIQEVAHYNLGNTLFETGRSNLGGKEAQRQDWQAALRHYESAMKLNPKNGRARMNHQFIDQLLKSMDQPPEDDENNDDQEDEEEEDPDQDQNQDQDQDQQDQQPPDQNPQQNPPPQSPPSDQQPPPPGESDPPPPNEAEPPPSDSQPPNSPPQDQQQPPPQQPPKPQDRDWTPEEARNILDNNSDEEKNASRAEATPVRAVGFKPW